MTQNNKPLSEKIAEIKAIAATPRQKWKIDNYLQGQVDVAIDALEIIEEQQEEIFKIKAKDYETLLLCSKKQGRIEDLEAENQSLLSKIKEREWQDISTAPRDGSWINAWDNYEKNWVYARWSDNPDIGGWEAWNGEVENNVTPTFLCFELTHWLPLADRPLQSTEEEKRND